MQERANKRPRYSKPAEKTGYGSLDGGQTCEGREHFGRSGQTGSGYGRRNNATIGGAGYGCGTVEGSKKGVPSA
jgi:hypothetical protein